MAGTRTTVQMISAEEFKQFESKINSEGVFGAIEVYRALLEKGYSYAGWAKGVAAGDTITGQAALKFMQRREGCGGEDAVDSETVDKIRTDMALGYLEALKKNAEAYTETGMQDITFKQARDFHEKVFKAHGLNIDHWTLELPMKLIGKYFGGEEAQEAKWKELMKTEGDYLDAVLSSAGMFFFVREHKDGSFYTDMKRWRNTMKIKTASLMPKTRSLNYCGAGKIKTATASARTAN